MRRKVTDEAKASAAISEAEERIERLPPWSTERIKAHYKLADARREQERGNHVQAAREARTLLAALTGD